MARPTTPKGGRLANFKKRIPAVHLVAARGKTFLFILPGALGEAEIVVHAKESQDQLKFSLQARDKALVKQRQAAALEQFEAHMKGLSEAPIELSHKQRQAFAGLIYKAWAAALDNDPVASREQWTALADSIAKDRRGGTDPGLFIPTGSDEEDRRTRAQFALEARFGGMVDSFLGRMALKVTDGCRVQLVDAVAYHMEHNARLAARKAGPDPDYTPDTHTLTIPEWVSPKAPSKPVSSGPSLTFDQLFDKWAAEKQPANSTAGTYRSNWASLKQFVGHDDPAAVTAEDVTRWKDSLVAKGIKKTGSHLPSVKSLFKYAVANKTTTSIATNPAQGIVMSGPKKKAGTSRLPYTTQEVAVLLAAAKGETKPARRWVPWLVALSGARVGETMQLWGASICQFDGIWCMSIKPAPDGGSLKNEGSERDIPIHPAIIEDGFLDFVTKRGNRPLFYAGTGHKAATSKNSQTKRHPSKGEANRLAQWIREDLGFKNPRKAPNHSLRHWFKTRGLELEVSDRIIDAIQGHAPSDTAAGYAHASINMMLATLKKFDVPKVDRASG